MRIEINKNDRTNEILMFTVSMLYILTIVFMALTNDYAKYDWRNNISFFGTKTSMLLTAIVFFRSTRGLLSFFAMALLIVCCVNSINEFLYIFKVCNTDSYLLIFIETVLVFLALIAYKLWRK